ncbi:transporter substrate-binding domain-containing protein [Roseibium denhamense]|uniref:General L-amino acid transport system substrate-binding protein n=1 Tax=Roseibium denhamense TaxID=76305 RepID=A0ABY1P1K9_9HYPH|nr:transporter substrate-binding domain-containing protein [Roseibium denhamense]MTI07600.1 transporter substrate-binding domain-containing protein [Roseibium denhamense]SMP24032.1 general L-amino acid transport system substrate-binding protein [Roseibium denhamense]
MKLVLSSLVAAMTAAAASPALAGPVLDEIKEKDQLICLVNPNSPGFSVPDSNGVYQGFNTDFCRMAAAAILGDAGKADIRGIGFSDSMKTLVADGAHMASRSITATGTRDADAGMAFVATTFYDGQGFMIPKSIGVTSATQLEGATVCAEDGSTTLLNIADWFSDRTISYRVENIADKTARLEAFFNGKCDVYASDVTALLSDRLLSDTPEAYTILPEVISAEPLTLVTQPDQALEAAVFWAFQVMLNADVYGITSDNVDQIIADLGSYPKAVNRLFAEDSATAEMAEKLGLPQDWAYQVISQVGAYSEVFEKHLGKETAFGLELNETANALTADGGQMYAYPIR